MGKNTMALPRAFAILGVLSNAAPEDIHRAYRQLVKRWHPDQFGLNTRAHCEAEDQLKLINQAYGIIKVHLKNRPQTKPHPARPTPPQKGRFTAHKTFFHTLFGPATQRAAPQPHHKPTNTAQAPSPGPPPGFQQILQNAHQHPKRFKSATVYSQQPRTMVKRYPLQRRRRGNQSVETIQPISRIRPIAPIHPIGDDE